MAKSNIKKLGNFHTEPIFEGRTFGDFLLEPQLGTVESRRDVVLKARLSRHIELNLPIIASNMDSVTGPEMCIALAQEGGIGFLPRSDAISIEQQVGWVQKVKRSESFIIEHPYTILENQTVREARAVMAEHRVSTLLVVGTNGALVGKRTAREKMRLCENDTDLVRDWMKRLSDTEYSQKKITSLDEARAELIRCNQDKLPLVDRNFNIRGLITIKDINNLLHHRWANKDAKGRLRVGAAIGARGDFMERSAELIKSGVDVIVMDTAHAHSVVVGAAIKRFRKRFGESELIAGNVASYDAGRFLAQLGVDGVKVGIGAGFGCRTRLEAGVGTPQIQAIRSVWHALAPKKIPFIADAGCKVPGHVGLALLTGGSSVMLGSMLAGTDEAPGELVSDPSTGMKYKMYRGMTSPEAKMAGKTGAGVKNVEGQSQRVPYVGSVKDILVRIREGLQSMVSYAGFATLEDARAKINPHPERYLIPLSRAAQEESFKR